MTLKYQCIWQFNSIGVNTCTTTPLQPTAGLKTVRKYVEKRKYHSMSKNVSCEHRSLFNWYHMKSKTVFIYQNKMPNTTSNSPVRARILLPPSHITQHLWWARDRATSKLIQTSTGSGPCIRAQYTTVMSPQPQPSLLSLFYAIKLHAATMLINISYHGWLNLCMSTTCNRNFLYLFISFDVMTIPNWQNVSGLRLVLHNTGSIFRGNDG